MEMLEPIKKAVLGFLGELKDYMKEGMQKVKTKIFRTNTEESEAKSDTKN